MRFWTLLLVSLILAGFVVAQKPEETNEPEVINQANIRLDDAIRLLAKEAKINLVLPFELDKKITIQNERQVDALKLLQIVCATHGYELVKDGDIYTVTEVKKKDTTSGEPSSTGMVAPMTTGISASSSEEGSNVGNFQLLRTPVEQAEGKIRSMLSIQGKLEINRDANAINVLDNPANVKQIKDYVDFLNMDPAAAFEARMEQRTFKINRMTAETIDAMATKMVSEKGKFVFDKTSMTVTIIERKEVLDNIAAFINAADQAEPQLYIRCHFVEVSLEAGTLLATKFSVSPHFTTSGEMGTMDTGFNLIPSTLGSQDVTSFSITDPKNNFTASLSATANRDNYRLLSSPNLLCYNKQKSTISITTQLPYYESTVNTASTPPSVTKTVAFKEVGIKMEVLPEIYSDGTVKLNIKPEVGEKTSDFDGIPVIRTKNVESNVLVKDGQVIVIAGLLEDQVTKIRYKVPLLGDIPLLGFLFSREEQTMKKTELVIFLHVTLMNDAALKNMANQKWREQEEQFQRFDTEYEFYPHLKEKLDMQKLNPRYDQSDVKASNAKAKVADNFEFAPRK